MVLQAAPVRESVRGRVEPPEDRFVDSASSSSQVHQTGPFPPAYETTTFVHGAPSASTIEQNGDRKGRSLRQPASAHASASESEVPEADQWQRQKRRFFGSNYVSRQLNGSILRSRVRVFWGGENAWFSGVVEDFSRADDCHLIIYDDGDMQWFCCVAIRPILCFLLLCKQLGSHFSS